MNFFFSWQCFYPPTSSRRVWPACCSSRRRFGCDEVPDLSFGLAIGDFHAKKAIHEPRIPGAFEALVLIKARAHVSLPDDGRGKGNTCEMHAQILSKTSHNSILLT